LCIITADASINSSLITDDGEVDTSVNKKGLFFVIVVVVVLWNNLLNYYYFIVVEISDAITRGAKAFLW
jgi:hypothetical protein